MFRAKRKVIGGWENRIGSNLSKLACGQRDWDAGPSADAPIRRGVVECTGERRGIRGQCSNGGVAVGLQ